MKLHGLRFLWQNYERFSVLEIDVFGLAGALLPEDFLNHATDGTPWFFFCHYGCSLAQNVTSCHSNKHMTFSSTTCYANIKKLELSIQAVARMKIHIPQLVSHIGFIYTYKHTPSYTHKQTYTLNNMSKLW